MSNWSLNLYVKNSLIIFCCSLHHCFVEKYFFSGDYYLSLGCLACPCMSHELLNEQKIFILSSMFVMEMEEKFNVSMH